MLLSHHSTEKKKPGVYILIREDGKRAYIGSSTNIKNRLRYHYYLLTEGKHENKELQKDFNNGYKFDYKVLKYFEDIERVILYVVEYGYIYKYINKYDLYNIEGFKSELTSDKYFSFCHHFSSIASTYFTSEKFNP